MAVQEARGTHCPSPATTLPRSPPPAQPSSWGYSSLPCGEGVLPAPEADGSLARTTLPQASPYISARIPLPLPNPPGLGQTSASRPPSFDQYRASSQGGCRLHPPGRPQLSRGHMGEGPQPGSGALGGGAGQGRARKAGPLTVIHSFTHSFLRTHLFSPQIFSEHQLCPRQCHQLLGHSRDKTAALVEPRF